MNDKPISKRPRGRDDVVFRELVEEWVLYDPRTRQLHVLNHTAALVWGLLDGTLDEDGVVETVRSLVDDAPSEAVVRGHVREAVERFRREGLLA